MSTTKAYPGSCHCGNVTYQLRLQFPPIMKPGAESIRIYKCNCTTCQKMGYFHCRPINPANDFILTSPASIDELGDWRVFTKKQGWYFCKTCGVRIVGLGGEWEQVDLDVEHWAGTKDQEDKEKLQKVWRTTALKATEGEEKKPNHYLSVNAVTLEPGGEIDLRKWHENGWIAYVERRNGPEMRVGEPYEGGMY